MTQDVQPLTWQKRTNLEEHQQFFSKINEIIDNLAPTVDEAEQAIAQATQAIASANDAIATANAASAAASAAASQAQTAASTVAGYDTRLTAAEGDIDALQAADQTIAGNITALGTRMTAAESKNTQQDTAIGALQTADAQNVKINAINQYAVGLTGDQVVFGDKLYIITPACNRNGVSNTSGYKRVFRSVSNTAESITHVLFGRVFNRNTNELVNWTATFRRGSTSQPTLNVDKDVGLLIALTTDGYIEIWCSNSRFNITIDAYFGDNSQLYKNAKNDFSTEIVTTDDPPTVGTDYQYVVTAVVG